ncbi:ParA family protein [Serratia sp. JSRIV006]|uniref:ParA family protein n=1 Tax=Serratia sp. JSRIV006 TaxID=2831896 RepID=UPI001CBFE2FF|nr:ParA family protein [Serratia sp. JSRIV006]UAN65938.1 ParA family protein [Serratia sp. JSRIV006]
MTLSVALASGKGGVSKSTLARALGVTYAKAGWSVLGADLDIGQATMANWMRRRIGNGIEPVFDVQSFGAPSLVKKKIDSDAWEFIVLDCAAFASKSTIEIALMVDLMVIPTRFSLDDLESTVNTANSLVKAGIPVNKLAVVFSAVAENAQDFEDAKAYMEQTPYFVIEGYIPQKPALSKAQDLGRSIIECAYVAPRERADKVVQGIIDRLEAITE